MTPRRMLRLLLPAVLVIAAVIAIRMFGGGSTVERDGLTFADGDLAQALSQPGDTTGIRKLSEFFIDDRTPCIAFLASDLSGIACHERGGWHLRVGRKGVSLDDPAEVAANERALRQAAGAMTGQ